MSGHHDDYDVEPIPGLPAVPPMGERIVWQGSPEWRHVARHILHIHAIAAYFAALVAWRVISGTYDGQTFATTVGNLAPFLVAAFVAIGLLVVIARAIARTTIYTITSRRVVMRFGVALPVTFNLPFVAIESAGVREGKDGHGDINLTLMSGKRIAYLVLWPHARPWTLKSPQPMFRAIPDVRSVAGLLREALEGDVAARGVRRMPEAAASTHNAVPAEHGLVAAE
ncbi:MAG TPA: photosynthetic complex putative assembly protein PuhB [Hyphomicrobiaceae bacterium]|nr:photosynthetic complex putative assembly protein PuhB [Hyphomicrobiaceae bacterium]